VDSGGTAARREIWTSQKFGVIVELLIENKKVYRKEGKGIQEYFTFAEMLKDFNIDNLEMYIGILFDVAGNPASIESDKSQGFYSSSKEGYNYLLEKIRKSEKFDIEHLDDEKLQIKAIHKPSGLKIICGALYGDEVTEKLFRQRIPVSDLLLLKYDDIWLSQLMEIDERANLLKFGKNYIIIFTEILRNDWKLRELYDDFINSEGSEDMLEKLIDYLLNNYNANFPNEFCPTSREKEEYIADVIQFLGAVDA